MTILLDDVDVGPHFVAYSIVPTMLGFRFLAQLPRSLAVALGWVAAPFASSYLRFLRQLGALAARRAV